MSGEELRRLALERMTEPCACIPAELRMQLSQQLEVTVLTVPRVQVSKILKKLPKETALPIANKRLVATVVDSMEGDAGAAGTKDVRVLHRPDEYYMSLLRGVVSTVRMRTEHITIPMEARHRVDILEEVMPNPPTSFAIVGHIAHYNLREDQLPLKYFIGALTCHLEPTIRTVINKIDRLTDEFRVMSFELIGGVPDYETTHTEGGLIFRLDISKVFWNPRLGTEHASVAKRIAELIDRDALVIDATGGIGPFSLHLARHHGFKRLLCNDLNPESYRYMCENVLINDLKDVVECKNDDAQVLLQSYSTAPVGAVILNLPELSIDFLQAIRGTQMLRGTWFFVECFHPDIEDLTQLRHELSYRCAKQLFEGVDDGEEDSLHRFAEFDARPVRKVSPGKSMYLVEFLCTRQGAETEPLIKRHWS
ncbi:tRNA (guanine(37)-N1)-methyltransferase [Giardia muris]|uniref:tRNA (guanine(37)-N1)-methyltransferase n=1 Tax=Giardia muris TaxID=5742 RepID=A0A4Z1SV87_GIAMU|nr:tRNA (guanine(37)-N1)-methyltransferase [Giardia muris]|eukprot:TNJ27498.1 tRNA (guanine(37)-N1)-methyltransferase [Giardia muris]